MRIFLVIFRILAMYISDLVGFFSLQFRPPQFLLFFTTAYAYGNSEITSRKEENIEANSLPKVIFFVFIFFLGYFSYLCSLRVAIAFLLCNVRGSSVYSYIKEANDPNYGFLSTCVFEPCEDEWKLFELSDRLMRGVFLFILKMFWKELTSKLKFIHLFEI